MAAKLFLAIFAALALVNISNATLLQSRERPYILKFFNTTDAYELTLLKNQTEIIIDVLSGFVNNIKPENRGNSSTLIVKYIGELSLARNSNNLAVLKQKYRELESLGNRLLDDFNIFPTKENKSLQQQWLGLIVLPFKFMPSSKVYAQKLKRSASILEGKFSDPGKRRHRKLFRLLTSLHQIIDPALDENFMKRFAAIKRDYRSGRL